MCKAKKIKQSRHFAAFAAVFWIGAENIRRIKHNGLILVIFFYEMQIEFVWIVYNYCQQTFSSIHSLKGMSAYIYIDFYAGAAAIEP